MERRKADGEPARERMERREDNVSTQRKGWREMEGMEQLEDRAGWEISGDRSRDACWTGDGSEASSICPTAGMARRSRDTG